MAETESDLDEARRRASEMHPSMEPSMSTSANPAASSTTRPTGQEGTRDEEGQRQATAGQARRGRATSPSVSSRGGEAREDFLDALRYSEQENTRRMQAMMDAQAAQLRAILQSNATERAEAAATAANHHGGSSTRNWAMNNTRMMDTRDTIKMESWDGSRPAFDSYKLSIYMCIGALSSEHLAKLQLVERSLDTSFKFSALSEDDKVQAREIYPHLVNSTSGTAKTNCLGCEHPNGFEVWKALCKHGLVRDNDAALHLLQHPTFEPNCDPRVRIQQWIRQKVQYEEQFGDVVSDAIELSVLKRLICPEVVLNQSSLSAEGRKTIKCPKLLTEAITAYCEAEESRSQMAEAYGTGRFVNAIEFKKKLKEKYNKDNKGKGKKGRKGDKGDKADGKVKDKQGKYGCKGGKKDNKGKDHKAYGKTPAQGKAKWFGGHCDYCWRLGHKKANCWFKLEYEKWNGDKNNGSQSSSSAGPSKADGKGKADKIKKFLTQKSDGRGPDAMDVNMIQEFLNFCSQDEAEEAASNLPRPVKSVDQWGRTVNAVTQGAEEDGDYDDEDEWAWNYEENQWCFEGAATQTSAEEQREEWKHELFSRLPYAVQEQQWQLIHSEADFYGGGKSPSGPQENSSRHSPFSILRSSGLDSVSSPFQRNSEVEVPNARERLHYSGVGAVAVTENPRAVSSDIGSSFDFDEAFRFPGNSSVQIMSINSSDEEESDAVRGEDEEYSVYAVVPEDNRKLDPTIIRPRRIACSSEAVDARQVVPTVTSRRSSSDDPRSDLSGAVAEAMGIGILLMQLLCALLRVMGKITVKALMVVMALVGPGWIVPAASESRTLPSEYAAPWQWSPCEASVCTIRRVERNRGDKRPLVDSGSFTHCCGRDYAPEEECFWTNAKTMHNAEGGRMDHYGGKRVDYMIEGGRTAVDVTVQYDVTSASRPIWSVKKFCKEDTMTVFGPRGSKIIVDQDAIKKIERIMLKAAGVEIIEEFGSYVAAVDRVTSSPANMIAANEEGINPGGEVIDLHVPDPITVTRSTEAQSEPYAGLSFDNPGASSSSTNAPVGRQRGKVYSESAVKKAFKEAEDRKADEEMKEVEAETELQAEVELEEVKVKVQKLHAAPSAKDWECHLCKLHVPYRAWCEDCVAGRCPGAAHLQSKDLRDEDEVPTVEFDYAAGSSKVGNSENKVTLLDAIDDVHKATFTTMITSKGPTDVYTKATFKRWLIGLGFKKLELKTDQEPSTVSFMDEMIKMCKDELTIVPKATPKGSKGSLGAAESTHRSVQGLFRTCRRELGRRFKFDFPIGHFTTPWLIRHIGWILCRFMVKSHGKTAYESMRGRPYKRLVVPFLERCMMQVYGEEDKSAERWTPGIFVGKSEETDEFFFLTPDGFARSSGLRRINAEDAINLTYLNSCRGTPWNPSGIMNPLLDRVVTGSALEPGGKQRGLYITDTMLNLYGRDNRCRACIGLGGSHSPECRKRIEQLHIAAGRAVQIGLDSEGVATPGTPVMPPLFSTPGTPIGRRLGESSGGAVAKDRKRSARGSEEQPEEETAAAKRRRGLEDYDIGMVANVRAAIDESPQIELWKDKKAWNDTKFPVQERTAGRQKEVDSLTEFDCVTDDELLEGERAYDTTWVEEWRGPLVRSRLAVRQYNQGQRDDCFSPTPDTFFFHYMLYKLSTLPHYVCVIIDISVAFMHAETDEIIKVRVPKDIPSRTGIWRLKKALNGTRRASQQWTEFSAGILINCFEFNRNDHNPAIFYDWAHDVDAEQHGDDFMMIADRDYALELIEKFKKEFKVKIATVISLNPEDSREGHFLHRKISVDESGWHVELSTEYSDKLVDTMGVSEQRRASHIPGAKEIGKGVEEIECGAYDHSHFRSGAGIASYMCEGRPELAFATKELLRKASKPTNVDMLRLKKVASFCQGVPLVIQHFPWRKMFTEQLDVYVDSDWNGEEKTRKSTSGGSATLDMLDLKHWCSSQSSPSLSSGESEIKALVKGTVEGLYIVHLLSMQGVDLRLVLHTDSSTCLAHGTRIGNGKKMRHLEGAELWIQHLVRSKRMTIQKINGLVNPADLFTKYLSADRINFLMFLLGYTLIDRHGIELAHNDKEVQKRQRKVEEDEEEDREPNEEDEKYVNAWWEFLGTTLREEENSQDEVGGP